MSRRTGQGGGEGRGELNVHADTRLGRLRRKGASVVVMMGGLIFGMGEAYCQEGTGTRDGIRNPSILERLDEMGMLVGDTTVTGVLTEEDFLVRNGRRVSAWTTVAEESGSELLIEMTSDEFDPFLYVVGPGVREMLEEMGLDTYALTDDDGGLGLNARLCFRAPAASEYVLVVAGLSGGVGEYELRVTRGCAAEVEPGRDATPAEFDPWAVAVVDTVRLGVVESGNYGAESAVDEEGRPVAAWVLPVARGDRLAIMAQSDVIDMQVYVASRTGFSGAQARRGGRDSIPFLGYVSGERGTESVVCVSVGETEEFRIVPAGGWASEEGDYRLVVVSDPDEVLCPVANMSSDYYWETLEEYSSQERMLSVGSILEGVLTQEELKDPVEGLPIQAWMVEEAVEGEWITISLRSSAFEPRMRIAFSGIEEAETWSDVCYLDVQLRAPRSERFVVLVSAQNEWGEGPFVLDIQEGARTNRREQCEEGAGGDGLTEGVIEIGYEMEGELVGSALWVTNASEGDLLVISVESDEFDPVLDIYGPGGYLVGTDDDGGVGANSRLETAVREDGTYEIMVRAYSGEGGGHYRLRVVRTP